MWTARLVSAKIYGLLCEIGQLLKDELWNIVLNDTICINPTVTILVW